jgi:hypothetical protein
MNVPEDAQYEWYYKAYAPLDTPASMASPADHTTSIQKPTLKIVSTIFLDGWCLQEMKKVYIIKSLITNLA